MKNKVMTNKQLGQLAYNSCMWSEAVIMQWKRFLDSFENQQGELPWEKDTGSCFLAEKLFLITALNHSVVCLCRLNDELIQREDKSLVTIINKIASKEERQQIIDLRNMNEHDIDYMTGNGRKQSKFTTKFSNERVSIETSAFMTVLHGDIPIFLIGEIEIDKLVKKFQENMPDIKKLTQKVFEYYYW